MPAPGCGYETQAKIVGVTEVLIQGGRVLDPASGFDQTADVLIRDSVIARIGRVSPPAEIRRIDAEGCIVAPGLIDIHVHLREPDPRSTETIATGAAAALGGGFAAVCCMPNTHPPIDSASAVGYVNRRAALVGAARVFVVGAATLGRRGQQLAPIASMARAGAVAFSDDGDCVADAKLLSMVFGTVQATGRCFMQHCQDPSLAGGGQVNAGPMAQRLGLPGWPGEAEEIVIDRDIRLNRAIGCQYHAQHLSSGESVQIIRRARSEGQPVTTEVTPHHLLLTEDCCRNYDPQAKVNPPLRTARDIELLKEGVADGTITILATDHAPHPLDRKQLDFADAAFGIIGLECALPLYRAALIDDGVIDWPALLAMLTVNPARLVGIDSIGLGSLATGGPADVTVIDPDLQWTIDPGEFSSMGRNCPFAGREVRGRAIATIVGGEVRMLRGSERVKA